MDLLTKNNINMKNLWLFITGNYRRSLVVEYRKLIWKEYQKSGFTNTGYKIYKQIN